ncbi:MAG: hypothetical protein WKF79_00365 [Nocardioides sp.]
MEDQIDVIVADLEKFTRGEVIALALNVNANLRDSPPGGTPIDTGWASANWVPSVGEPFIEQQGEAAKEPTPGQIIARARVADEGQNDVLAWRNTDGPIFSTNNVPYIGALNNGHSAQSPRGFVQAAIEKAIRMTYSRAGSRASRSARASAARASKAKPR